MSVGYLLRNADILTSDGTVRADLLVRGMTINKIADDLTPPKGMTEIDCTGHIIVPGLINSHDHLDFNLFPRLGDPPYENVYDWGSEIQSTYAREIEAIRRVPFGYRLMWGAWKNLFSGVTHAVHHEPFSHHFLLNFPVNVLKRYTSAHSLAFERDIPHALAKRKNGVPFLIHVAEGRDEVAAREISTLHSLGGLDERTVAVHAVQIAEGDISLLERQKTSVVWCPSSNLFLFGKSTPIKSLLRRVPVALGTDSSLTGSVTMFDELRIARDESACSARELVSLVTDRPRSIFRLPEDAGRITEGGNADLFVIPRKGIDPYEDVLASRPGDIALLMRKGRIVFRDEAWSRLNGSRESTRICLNDRVKLMYSAKFARLHAAVRPFISHYEYISPA
jgi:cytosine/adenosine deaminase-related metal-dependent hydrolase